MADMYIGCCGSCIYLDTDDYVRHKDHCRCTKRGQYYNLTEKNCQYYEFDRNKDYYDLNHRWHIVSAVLGILQTTAQTAGVEKLHRFRVDVLEKDGRYENALRVYDVLGPFLACQLAHDPDAVRCCHFLLERWFLPMEALAANGEYEAVFLRYAEMVSRLKLRYAAPLEAYCTLKQICAEKLNMTLG